MISFSARVHSQGAKGSGIQTTAVGIDPRKKKIIKHTANNQNVNKRNNIGEQTVLVDGTTGELTYTENQDGEIIDCTEMVESQVKTNQSNQLKKKLKLHLFIQKLIK